MGNIVGSVRSPLTFLLKKTKLGESFYIAKTSKDIFAHIGSGKFKNSNIKVECRECFLIEKVSGECQTILKVTIIER